MATVAAKKTTSKAPAKRRSIQGHRVDTGTIKVERSKTLDDLKAATLAYARRELGREAGQKDEDVVPMNVAVLAEGYGPIEDRGVVEDVERHISNIRKAVAAAVRFAGARARLAQSKRQPVEESVVALAQDLQALGSLRDPSHTRRELADKAIFSHPEIVKALKAGIVPPPPYDLVKRTALLSLALGFFPPKATTKDTIRKVRRREENAIRAEMVRQIADRSARVNVPTRKRLPRGTR